VTVTVSATENEGGYLITANISDEKQGYMSLKAIMKN
jgi:hypothetical protein